MADEQREADELLGHKRYRGTNPCVHGHFSSDTNEPQSRKTALERWPSQSRRLGLDSKGAGGIPQEAVDVIHSQVVRKHGGDRSCT